MRLDRLKVIEDLADAVRETLRPETLRYEVTLKVDDLLKQIEATTQVMRRHRAREENHSGTSILTVT